MANTNDTTVNETVNEMTVATVLKAFSTIEDGNVTDFDFEAFSSLVDELVEKRKEMKASKKEAEKAKKEEAKAKNEEAGKAYFLGLEVGDRFQYTTADGTVVTAIKIKTKSGVYNTAACEVISGIEITKSNKRYPKFYSVIVPEDEPVEDETDESTDDDTEDPNTLPADSFESMQGDIIEDKPVDPDTMDDGFLDDDDE